VAKNNNDAENFISSQMGAFGAINTAQETNEAIRGMIDFKNIAEQMINLSPDQKHGNLFEIIEATKFNMNAASKGSDIRAYLTALEGKPHDAVDIQIRDINGNILENVQAKSYKKATGALRALSDEKYRDMQKLVNSDQEDRVKELAKKAAERNEQNIYNKDYVDTEKNVTGKLHHGDISSKGTSYDEAMNAAENSSKYAFVFEAKQFVKEVGVTGAEAAVAGAVFGGAMSIIKNGLLFRNDEIDAKEAGKNIISDTGKAAVKSGTTGAAGAGIRITAQKAGIEVLSKSNIATSVAASLIQTGIVVYDYIKGDISSGEAAEKIGQNGISTASSIFVGASAGMIFGPLGAVVGSIAGYMIASNVYQSCLVVLKNAELNKIQYRKAAALYNEASNVIRRQREEFEAYAKEKLDKNKKVFDHCMAFIDYGLSQNSNEDVIHGLANLMQHFGKELQMQDFDEFDDFLLNGSEPLKL